MPTHPARHDALTPALLASLVLFIVSERTHAQATEAPPTTPPAPSPAAHTTPKSFQQEVPGAAFAFTMVLIPGDDAKGIKPFYIATTELTWPAFDPFVYRLDDPSAAPAGQAGADATTRPSKPYLPPDRGFGHDGYAAISMSFHSAEMYCKWLSEKSGLIYRLPTEAEWAHAAGGTNALPADAALTDFAWFNKNADGKPHPVATKAANAHGLHDMLGNVQEWCVGADGKPVTKGGSYRDPAERLTTTHRAPFSSAWNASDPQMPKSKWWLADGPFVGFRVVCEAPEIP